MKPFASEAALAAVVVNWLRDQDWTVYQEVYRLGSVCDIVAARGPLLWAIETKLAFGVSVLDQAQFWLLKAHLVSVATPWTSHHMGGMLGDWCDGKGIGILQVSRQQEVHERKAAQLRRRIMTDLRAALRPEQLSAVAGTAGGGHWTPFKETCRSVEQAVAARPGFTLKELMDSVRTHYSSRTVARAGIVRWIEGGKIGVRIEREGKTIRLYPPALPATEDR